MSVPTSYEHTLKACYLGYITQSIIVNFVPLLFLTFSRSYGIPLSKVTFLITLTFGTQLIVDFLSAQFVDKIGYRVCIVTAHILAAVGLIGLGVFPELFSDAYTGLVVAAIIYACGSGIIEVLISPIVEACPTDNKSAAMSLLHSFYCWGTVFVILISTAFFSLFGIENWKVLSIFWATIPAFNAVYFFFVPISHVTESHEGMSILELCKTKFFWIFIVLMVCAGAAEQSMSQWASAFAESGLKVSKTIGDLAGPCMSAACMGIGRVLHSKISEKVDLLRYMISCGLLCIVAYLLAAFALFPVLSLFGCALCGFSVGVFWPGIFSYASLKCSKGGTAMFALLALAGDLGCGLGPTAVGLISGMWGDNLKLGLSIALIFPIILILGLYVCKKDKKGKLAENSSL